jgi:hypothetical protein
MASQNPADCSLPISEALKGVTDELFDGKYEPLDRGSIRDDGIAIATGFQYPLVGNQEYRGWYPIDSGTDRGKARWCPSQSKFNGRNGQHKGADLYAVARSLPATIYAGQIRNISFRVECRGSSISAWRVSHRIFRPKDRSSNLMPSSSS